MRKGGKGKGVCAPDNTVKALTTTTTFCGNRESNLAVRHNAFARAKIAYGSRFPAQRGENGTELKLVDVLPLPPWER